MSNINDLFEKGRWYHCFRYEDMVSNGTYDVEKYIHHYQFDDDYGGKTVLDVGCSDGYFSFWVKKNGAKRVLGIDSNKYDGSLAFVPANAFKHLHEEKYKLYSNDYLAFKSVYEDLGLDTPNKLLLMRKLTGLDVEYSNGSVYDLTPYGEFDIVMCNDLLEHLRDPISAVEQLYFSTKEKCIITVSSAMKTNWLDRNKPVAMYVAHESGGAFFNLSETAGMAICKSAGFRKVEVVSRFDMMNRRHRVTNPHFVLHAYK